MAKNYHVDYEITTHKGRVIKKGATVSDPAKHFAEYLKRFHPTAKKIEWWHTDPTHRQVMGIKRWVEFDREGKVVSRGPDVDVAHVSGSDWQPDPNNPLHDPKNAGDSRSGIDPADPSINKDIGRHPNANYDDEDADILAKEETEEGFNQPVETAPQENVTETLNAPGTAGAAGAGGITRNAGVRGPGLP